MIEPATQVEPTPIAQEPLHHDRPRGTLSIIQWLISVVVIAAFVMTFIVQAFVIPSDSMENTLLVGDYLLVDKIPYADSGIWRPLLPYSTIKRGDIVVFHYPVNPVQHFVKRVVAVPGDRLHLVNKHVFVNGNQLIEPYTIFKSPTPDFFRDDFPTTRYISGNVESKWWLQMRKLMEDGNLIVPEGHYFVLGDNRDDSLDSRYWGFVPAENIVGRPLLIYWSMNPPDDDDSDIRANPTWNAKLTHLLKLSQRLFRDTRWKRTMTVVH